MKILDNIRAAINRRDNHTIRYYGYGYVPEFSVSCHPFGETLFLNIVEILTDIYAEVEWQQLGVTQPTAMFTAWRDWAYRNGQRILVKLYRDKGYCVIGWRSDLTTDGKVTYAFYEIPDKDYTTKRLKDGREVVELKDNSQNYYVLKSPTFEAVGMSDHKLCEPFIKMLDAVLNGATTTAERLGAYVLMSPQSDNFGGVLEKSEKEELEQATTREYGMLSRQKQIMLMPRPMQSQVISLAGVDTKMQDKARTAILGIADRIKVPANQIAFIDANSSKSLSNGTELREGDLSKYRQFRRVLNATFYDMAKELGMSVNYTIENEPLTVQGQQIEQQ